jgi:hypothetical protein
MIVFIDETANCGVEGDKENDMKIFLFASFIRLTVFRSILQ